MKVSLKWYYLKNSINYTKRSNSKLKIYNDFIFILEMGSTEELTEDEIQYIKDNIDPMGDQGDLVDPEVDEEYLDGFEDDEIEE